MFKYGSRTIFWYLGSELKRPNLDPDPDPDPDFVIPDAVLERQCVLSKLSSLNGITVGTYVRTITNYILSYDSLKLGDSDAITHSPLSGFIHPKRCRPALRITTTRCRRSYFLLKIFLGYFINLQACTILRKILIF